MKKLSIIFVALAASFALSCNKEMTETETTDPSAPAGMKKVTITATAEGATKTSYTDNGEGVGVFSWTKGDQISLLATDNQLYTFIAETSGTATNFAGYIPEGESVGRFAYFPASENHTYTTDWWSQYSIDEYKDMNGLASAEIPMYGLKGEDDSYTFTHLTGAVQFTFTNIPDGLDEVEISIKNEQCKFSGLWKVSTSNWGWSAAYTTNDSELTFTRVVPVKNNSAQLYLPYNGGIWYDSILNIKALDASGNEMILLKDKNVKGNGTAIERAQIVPYAPLALPAYVPSVDWTKVDWTADNVVSYVQEDWMYDSYPQYSDIKELKAFADEYYLYARVIPTKVVNQIRFFLADKGEKKGGDLWMWEQTGYTTFYKSDKATVSDNLFSLSYNGVAVELVTETVDGNVVWNMAIPRSAGDWTASSESVYIGFITYGEDFEAPIPKVWGEMLEVTLP